MKKSQQKSLCAGRKVSENFLPTLIDSSYELLSVLVYIENNFQETVEEYETLDILVVHFISLF